MQFKRRLESSRDEILRFLNHMAQEAQTTNVNYVRDIGDLSIMNVLREELFQRGTQKRQQLQMIVAALARIEDGSFGKCGVCGKTIEAKRLAAMPWTQSCLKCQQTLERPYDENRRQPSRSKVPYSASTWKRK